MKLLRTLKDVFLSSLPLLAVIVIVAFLARWGEGGLDAEGIIKIAIGYILVIIGQAFFLIGLDNSILPIGKLVGSSLIKLKKAVLIILFGVVFGMLATVAEPALAVFAKQVASINILVNSTLLVFILGAGVGVTVGFALYRVLKNLNLKIVFLVAYVAIFLMVLISILTDTNQYISLAFDGSGATTGDVSVPFILALGLGVSTTMSKSKTNEESFGIIGLASVGPILAVLLYGMILGDAPILNPYTASQDMSIGTIITDNLLNVTLAVLPIVAVFFVFQFFLLKMPRRQLIKLLLGSGVVFAGLFVFLFGIDLGFSFAGKLIGDTFTDTTRYPEWFPWLLLIVGFILGFAITLTEPAVTVLGEQVEEITNGMIKKRLMRMTLALGIGLAGLISILKILLDINILWFLVPLYVISLLLMLFTPKLFVGLAFDSGGVSGGAITSAFLTPLTLGVSQSLGQGNILSSGFGMIAFISVMPLITVQLLGILYANKTKRMQKAEQSHLTDDLQHLTEDDGNETGATGSALSVPRCPDCGRDFEPNAAHCPNCGADISEYVFDPPDATATTTTTILQNTDEEPAL